MCVYLLLLFLQLAKGCLLPLEAEKGLYTGEGVIENHKASQNKTVLLLAGQEILFNLYIPYEMCHISISDIKCISSDHSSKNVFVFLNGLWLSKFKVVTDKTLQLTNKVLPVYSGGNQLRITTSTSLGIEIDQLTLQITDCSKATLSSTCPQSMILPISKSDLAYNGTTSDSVDMTPFYIVVAIVTGILIIGILFTCVFCVDDNTNNNN